ncbi:hypothetical protein LAD77_00770 [Klebsiella pneumoniae]|nr:hypothetical protein [Klebsiella pneumoniae]
MIEVSKKTRRTGDTVVAVMSMDLSPNVNARHAGTGDALRCISFTWLHTIVMAPGCENFAAFPSGIIASAIVY